MSKARTEFLNVDIDLKSKTDPESFVQALGSNVRAQRLGKIGRKHWVKLTLARAPKSPADAILGFAKLVAGLPRKIREIWINAESREFDIGIQCGVQPNPGEWVLGCSVAEAAARLGASMRITVYSPEFSQSLTNLNKLAKKVLKTVSRLGRGFSFIVRENGELEAILKAPRHSLTGHLIVLTNKGDIWVGLAVPHALYSVDDTQELIEILKGYLSNEILFAVVTYRNRWLETTLVRRNGNLRLDSQSGTVQLVSWSGEHDKTFRLAKSRPTTRPRNGEIRTVKRRSDRTARKT